MSADGTLPPGTSHADIERAFGGPDDDDTLCCECSEPRLEDSVDGTMCNACAANHYRGMYRLAKRALEQMRREAILPAPIHTATPCPAQTPGSSAASALASNL